MKRNCKDHLGNVYSSIKDMCDFYSINVGLYRSRMNNLGWSLEKALTESVHDTFCEDHLGNKYNSEKDMCEAYQIDYRVFWARTRDAGWSLEKALTTPIRDDSCVDHLGNRYDSVSKMCAAYNINKLCYKKRIKNGWSIEDALTLPSGSRNPSNELWTSKGSGKSKSCKDHRGNDYPSFTAMCKAYDMPQSTVKARIDKYGWSLEDALTKPVHITKGIECFDDAGKSYPSIRKMCRDHGVSISHYSKRIQKGYSIKDALNPNHRLPIPSKKGMGIGSHRKRGDFYDHKGNKYDSFKDMCDFYNISPTVVRARMYRNGYTLEEALETPIQKTAYDHNGHKFDSLTEMCSYYNISYTVYNARINKYGWSQKDALTIPVNMSSKQYTTCKDHLGNHYINLKQMCDAYDRDYNLFLSRRRHGWTIQEALLIPRNMYIGEYRVAECLKRLNVEFYYDCTIKIIFTDLGISVDWNDFLSELQSKLGSVGYNWSKQKIQRLRPDFVLYTDEENKIRGVIEFDGEQHQNFIEFFFKTIEEFYKRSDTDFVKQSFWEYMNIPMLRIRHDQIDMIDDMVQDFIDNPRDYIHNHNTYLSEEEYWSILIEQKQQIELAFAV